MEELKNIKVALLGSGTVGTGDVPGTRGENHNDFPGPHDILKSGHHGRTTDSGSDCASQRYSQERGVQKGAGHAGEGGDPCGTLW